jgi:thiol-disulfide isomerase/thioredoxin
MKKLLGFLLLCTICIIEAKAVTGRAVLNCTVYGNQGSGLFLYQLKDGEALSLGFKRPNDNGQCKFEVDVKEGVYFFRKAGGKGSEFKHVIYLKAGDQKKVDLYLGSLSLDYDSCKIEKPNIETKYLTEWMVAFNRYTHSVSNKTDQSYERYRAFEKFAESFVQKKKTNNAYFNKWLGEKIDTDLKYLMAANYFHFGRRLNTGYDSSAVVQSFYKPLQDKKMVCNPALLRSENGMQLLNYIFARWKFNQVKNTKDLIATPFSEYTPLICNDVVKVAYLAYQMRSIKKYEDFANYVQPYKQLFASNELKAAYQKRYEDLYLFATGTPAYNFELKDVNDKVHRLSDFKGKVVIIDMWAMWCAPCLAEKPVMAKLEHEHYKDRNDIVFIGVSVDGINRSELWKGFIARNGFKGLELISNSTESIQKYYKIEGIPRFLIFDRAGKIVTVDAPMPSNPGFKKLVDKTLASTN